MKIADEFLLLALPDGAGKPRLGRVRLASGLGCALIADLALLGRIRVRDGQVIVAERRRPLRTDQWVARLGGGGLRERLLMGLVRRGFVGDERRRIWGVLPVRRHPVRSTRPGSEVRARLRALRDEERPDEHAAALLAIARAYGLEISVPR